MKMNIKVLEIYLVAHVSMRQAMRPQLELRKENKLEFEKFNFFKGQKCIYRNG